MARESFLHATTPARLLYLACTLHDCESPFLQEVAHMSALTMHPCRFQHSPPALFYALLQLTVQYCPAVLNLV